MALAYRTLVRNGIRRFCLADPMNDAAANVVNARLVKQAGGEFVIAALVFTLSPIHDDAHYAGCARTLAASPDIDALYIKDPGGLLSPKRAATLIPAITAGLTGSAGRTKPLELQSHNTIGLAEHTYLDAPALGVSALQCASGAAADGISNPPIQRIVANLRELGHRVDADDTALAAVANYFSALADAEGLAVGRPQGFDAAYLKHQLPGGTVGTMRRHLAESRIAHLEGAVLEELDRVRQELGWPIVMTPFAQMVITQAVMNVTGGRYETIPDEVIRYALGRFGKPNVPIDARVMDRIESLPRTRELRAEPEMDVDDLRRRFGAVSDEEFLLRATMPAGLVDAMRAAGPAARHYNPAARPLLEVLNRLCARRDLAEVTLEKPGFRLALRRQPIPGARNEVDA
jgi:oxaloacetate decarboxylase alpha subunit